MNYSIFHLGKNPPENCNFHLFDIDSPGFYDQFNRFLFSEKSKYIAISCDNVFSDENRFEIQSEFLDNHSNIHLVGSSIGVLNENFELKEILEYPENSSQCYKEFYHYKNEFVFDYSVMFNRQAAINSGGLNDFINNSDERLTNAYLLSLWCRILLRHKISNINMPLVRCSPVFLQESNRYFFEKNFIWGMFKRKSFKKIPLKQLVSNISFFDLFSQE